MPTKEKEHIMETHEPTPQELATHQWLKPKQTTMDEVHQIMFKLRGDNATKDGDYRNKHLGTILEYLLMTKREEKSITLQKLALMLGMAQRQIRENYFDGLVAFNIIGLSQNCQEWYWIGVNSLDKHIGELKK